MTDHDRTDAALVALVRTLMDDMGLQQVEQVISHARLRIRLGGEPQGADALARAIADKLVR